MIHNNFGFRFCCNMKSQMIKKPFRVAIEGNVGSGKSTLIKYFENFMDVEVYPVSIHLF